MRNETPADGPNQDNDADLPLPERQSRANDWPQSSELADAERPFRAPRLADELARSRDFEERGEVY
jgi:hypothetical protein